MNNRNSFKKVFVGLSGGVDSAVSALLLKNQGYNVTGVYMKNWSGESYGVKTDCPWEKDIEDASEVCKQIGIPFKSYNFEKEYRERVIKYFYSEYENGRTPNPDILCNKEIKFDLFLKKALSEGADFIATGHYAQIDDLHIKRGRDSNKDQSYFLCKLNQDQISKTIFPIGNLNKSEVRRIAKESNLVVADKKDSQGICFIGKVNLTDFLKNKIKTKKGFIINKDTNQVIGEHEGIYFYTIGQREGIKVGGNKQPLFVIEKDIDNNILYVVEGKNNPKLFKNKIILDNIEYINPMDKNLSDYEVSIRYRQKSIPCKIAGNTLILNTPLRAVSEGQVAVIYSNDKVVASGVIESSQ